MTPIKQQEEFGRKSLTYEEVFTLSIESGCLLSFIAIRNIMSRVEDLLEKILHVLDDHDYISSLGLSDFGKLGPYFSIASNLDRRHSYTTLGGSNELKGDTMIFLNLHGEDPIKVCIVRYNDEFLAIDNSRIRLEIRERLHYS